eukprot:294876-Chlamydomonas_euryale.AAC.3
MPSTCAAFLHCLRAAPMHVRGHRARIAHAQPPFPPCPPHRSCLGTPQATAQRRQAAQTARPKAARRPRHGLSSFPRTHALRSSCVVKPTPSWSTRGLVATDPTMIPANDDTKRRRSGHRTWAPQACSSRRKLPKRMGERRAARRAHACPCCMMKCCHAGRRSELLAHPFVTWAPARR